MVRLWSVYVQKIPKSQYVDGGLKAIPWYLNNIQCSSTYSCTIKVQCAFEPLITPLTLFSTNQQVITFSIITSGHDSEVFFSCHLSSQHYIGK